MLIGQKRQNNIAFPPIILASSSSRRKQLLNQLGIPFSVMYPTIDERTAPKSSGLEEYVKEVSLRKSRSVFRSNSIIIGADTLVVPFGVSQEIDAFGKPSSSYEALNMLRRLRENTHSVITGLSVLLNEKIICTAAKTKVFLHPGITDEMLRSYVATEEPIGKAGGYAIQGKGAVLIQRIEGSYSNVVGLPLAELAKAMSDIGYPLSGYWERK